MPEAGESVLKDVDVDAEMEETQATANTSADRNPHEASSGTLENEFTQSETQPATTTGLPHQNRKDVTLREFLSKMDDYAPIVRFPRRPTARRCWEFEPRFG